MPPNLQLTAVEIQNYKSIRKAHIPFRQRLVVFVGRNNSGKSNILDVFAFIHETMTDPAAALQRRGEGIADLLWAGDPTSPCTLRFRFDVPTKLRATALDFIQKKRQQNIVYRMQPRQVNESKFLTDLEYTVSFGAETFREQIETTAAGSPQHRYVLFRRAGGAQMSEWAWSAEQIWNQDASAPESSLQEYGAASRQIHMMPSLLGPPQRPSDNTFAINWVKSFFASHYHVPPHRRPKDKCNITSTESLDTEGSELADVLHTLYTNQPEIFRAIERDLKNLVEGIAGISSRVIQPAQTTVRITEDFGELGSRAFYLNQTSAGTAQLLILLTQLHTVAPNTLLLLEEMESLLHPRAQAEFARILRSASAERSIIISTHSPAIASETPSESLFVVRKTAGATSISGFDESMADILVEDMGIRPSFSFESNSVVFVEGIHDEAVFRMWLDARNLCARVKFIDSGGYSNIQFFANAKILKRKAVRVEVFAVVDGDTRAKGDYEQVKRALDISKERLFELKEQNLECYLANPTAILKSFASSIRKTPEQLESELQGKTGDELKAALNRVLRPVGGYTPDTAARVASYVDPPADLVEFFETVDAADKSLA